MLLERKKILSILYLHGSSKVNRPNSGVRSRRNTGDSASRNSQVESQSQGQGDGTGEVEDVRQVAPWWTGSVTVTPAFTQEAIKRSKDNTDTIYDWWGTASGGGIMVVASYARSFMNWVSLQRAIVFPFFGKLKPKTLSMLEESLHEFPKDLKSGAAEPWRGKAVRIYVTFEKQSAKKACMQALSKGTLVQQIEDTDSALQL